MGGVTFGNATKIPVYGTSNPEVAEGDEPILGLVSDLDTVKLWNPPKGLPRSRCPNECGEQEVGENRECDFCNDPNVTSNNATGWMEMYCCTSCNWYRGYPTHKKALKRKWKGDKGYCKDCSSVRWLACVGDNYANQDSSESRDPQERDDQDE